jgi:ferric-dicitrate binding protein FerR (iron transport regulator)
MNRELLNKYIAGDASQEEKETVQLWTEADEKNREEYMSMRTLYNITLGHLPEEKQAVIAQKSKKRQLLADLLKIAAAILITFGCTYYVLQSQKDKKSSVTDTIAMQTLHVPAGQRVELTLSDGTKVWLNSHTTFIFPTQFTETTRDVYLDGEGYFDVTKDAGKQFKVNTQDHIIKVLGTEFNVFAYSKNNSFETSLIDGAVEIATKDNRLNIPLTPGNRSYRENDRLTTSPIRDYDYFLWKKGIISFNHERVEDILKKLELYYDIQIENHNKRIINVRYTGKFRTKDGIEHVLNVLQVPTGLRYKKDNEKNLIQIY